MRTKLMPTSGSRIVRDLFNLIREQDVQYETLARRSGVDSATVASWRHKHGPSLPLFEAVAGALGYELALVNRKTGRAVGAFGDHQRAAQELYDTLGV